VSQHQLQVLGRETTGKEAAKRLRRDGYVPAIAYGHKEEPVKLSVHLKTLRDLIKHEGSHGLFNLQQEGAADLPVIIKVLQKHPVSHEIITVDFLRVNLDEKVRSVVPLHLEGTPEGVKVDGGVLVQALHEIEVEAFPQSIPDIISVDVTGLTFNGAPIHVREITLPAGVVAITDCDESIAVVNPPTVAAAEPAADSAAVPATEVSAEAAAADVA
jgi:large subunit ribosomal protein L25